MTKAEILKGLTETLFYLAICCYSEDKEEQKKVERMATAVSEGEQLLRKYMEGDASE